jgi:hypothetical protein
VSTPPVVVMCEECKIRPAACTGLYQNPHNTDGACESVLEICTDGVDAPMCGVCCDHDHKVQGYHCHPIGTGEPPDEFKQIAWASFLTFAANDPDFRQAFTAATGKTFALKNNHSLHDDMRELMTEFVEWLTREHYGLEHAPKAYRDHVEGKKA